MKSCIEELAGSYFQILADFQEVLHGRQGAPGRNGLDVTFVFAEIQAHLIFGYILFYPQFGNPVTDKFFSMSSTSLPTSSFDFKLFTSGKLRNKIELFTI